MAQHPVAGARPTGDAAVGMASVAQAPRRAPAGVEPVAQVQFQGDSENDVTPVRTVPLKHLFRAIT